MIPEGTKQGPQDEKIDLSRVDPKEIVDALLEERAVLPVSALVTQFAWFLDFCFPETFPLPRPPVETPPLTLDNIDDFILPDNYYLKNAIRDLKDYVDKEYSSNVVEKMHNAADGVLHVSHRDRATLMTKVVHFYINHHKRL